MKRKFFIYRYINNSLGTKLSYKILLWTTSQNKSIATLKFPKQVDSNIRYLLTIAQIPEEYFFFEGDRDSRPFIFSNPLIKVFESEDDYYFPSNENMNRLRKIDPILSQVGPLNFRNYSIGININIEEFYD